MLQKNPIPRTSSPVSEHLNERKASNFWRRIAKLNDASSPLSLSRTPLQFLLILFAFSISLSMASTSQAWQVKLQWDQNDPVPDGYRVFARQEGQIYDYANPKWEGVDNSCTVSVDGNQTDYYFVVRAFVTNDESGDSNEVKYTTPATNNAPTANAGADQTLDEQTTLTLDGSASSDPDGNIVSYSWNQLSGPTTTITGSSAVQPSCTAPDVAETTTLVFELTVTDAGGLTSTDTCQVTVNPVVDPTLDSDKDGITDVDETAVYGTDPLNADTDGDGFTDGQEIASGTDPKNAGSTPQAVSLWIEAEEGDIYSPMAMDNNAQASGDLAIWTPEGAGIYKTYSSDAGRAVYSFDIPADGSYVVWGRVIANDSASDSFYVTVDGQTPMVWHTMQGGVDTWIWDVVTERDFSAAFDTTSPNVYQLSAGTHTIEFAQREDGAKLDRILITNDPGYVPEGQGPTAQSNLWIEAEDGNIYSPMVIDSNAQASGELCILAPKGSGNYKTISSDAGRAVYTFDIQQAGNYVIWGRVIANDAASDSFFVSVDSQSAMAWHTIRGERDTWTWDVISERNVSDVFDTTNPKVYALSAGTHTITFTQRENGTMLDKLLITKDLSFIPEP